MSESERRESSLVELHEDEVADDMDSEKPKPHSPTEPLPVPPSVHPSGISVQSHKLWIGNLDKRLTEWALSHSCSRRINKTLFFPADKTYFASPPHSVKLSLSNTCSTLQEWRKVNPGDTASLSSRLERYIQLGSVVFIYLRMVILCIYVTDTHF